MTVELEPLVEALKAHVQVTLTYEKEKTGEIKTHTGGIYEIGPHKSTGKGVLYLWDTELNDHIRCFILDNITNYTVLSTPFSDVFGFGFKLNGELIP